MWGSDALAGAHVHDVDPLIPVAAAVEQEIAASSQAVGKASIFEGKHHPPPLVAVFFLNPRDTAPFRQSFPHHSVSSVVAQTPGVGAAVEIGHGDGHGVGAAEEIAVVHLEEHVRVAGGLIGAAGDPGLAAGRQVVPVGVGLARRAAAGGGAVADVAVAEASDGRIVGLHSRAAARHVVVLLQPEVVVAPLRIPGAWAGGALPAGLPGQAVFAHGHPDAGGVLQRHAHVMLDPVEDGQILGLVGAVATRIGVEVRIEFPEEVKVQPQVGRVLVQAVEHTPVHLIGVAEHVVVGLEGRGQYLVVQQHAVVHAAVGATVSTSENRPFLIRVQGVGGKTHAPAGGVKVDLPPLPGGEGVGRGLHHEHFLQLAVFAEGFHVPVHDLVDGLDPEIAGQPRRGHLCVVRRIAGPGFAVQPGANGDPFQPRVIAVTLAEGEDELPVGVQVGGMPVLGDEPATAHVHDGVGILAQKLGHGFAAVFVTAVVGADPDGGDLARGLYAVQPIVQEIPIVHPRLVLYLAPVDRDVAADEVVVVYGGQLVRPVVPDAEDSWLAHQGHAASRRRGRGHSHGHRVWLVAGRRRCARGAGQQPTVRESNEEQPQQGQWYREAAGSLDHQHMRIVVRTKDEWHTAVRGQPALF